MTRCNAVLRKLNKLIKWTSKGFVYDGKKYSIDDLNKDLLEIGRNAGCYFSPAIIIDPSTKEDSSDASEDDDDDDDDERFNNDGTDNSAIESEHEEEEEEESAKYSCSRCESEFSSQAHLSKHINVHRASKSVKNQKTNNNSVFAPPKDKKPKQDVPIKRHHGVKMSFQCCRCGKNFTRKDNCARHLSVCSSIRAN
jgi:DNA-directed RNA polymerase subunit RPC12/RpoP